MNYDKQYQDLLRDILTNGTLKETRSGNVYSVFDRSMRINLSEGFPLLTTKKMFTRGIIYELLWFLSGDTNIKYLVDHGVHIWDDDAYRFYLQISDDMRQFSTKTPNEEEFLRLLGTKTLHNGYVFGDLGPIYGRQWRNYGISGRDQIGAIIDTLKTNPNDRRMVLCGWNPDVLDKVALPACHTMAIFYTRQITKGEEKCYELSCSFFCRSQDVFLGTPFNVASYALLTHMLSQCAGMIPGELVWHGVDCHLYANHIEPAKELLSRDPLKYNSPILSLNPSIKEIDRFEYKDINIKDYESFPPIKAPLSVGL